ncbi:MULTISPECIES: ANR family transcriptional regulator [Cedecea]|uniref:ANR family transcriptional regulator n=1 Tax=Cedecea TaxID=158483 RepID=UPI001FE84D36|nr:MULTISPECIES: ANR family transcriptional regulator [Cedecea]
MSELWPPATVSGETQTQHQLRDSLAYYPEARKAIRLEQAGDYLQANRAWENAYRVSCHKLNQQWSKQRAEFCMKQSA